MRNYRVQDGCWNCEHVLSEDDFEGPTQYYCGLKIKALAGPKAPESDDHDGAWVAFDRKWLEFCKKRTKASVECHGICDHFQKARAEK